MTHEHSRRKRAPSALPAKECVKESRAGQGAFADYRAAQKWTPAFAGATNSKAKSNYSVIPAKAGIHSISRRHR
ncbi:MAG TPA: hypothetical protein VMA53_10705, partial [Stellaceae bacterium]|nr:hypothetical protein [Stellaceae bacterium]